MTEPLVLLRAVAVGLVIAGGLGVVLRRSLLVVILAIDLAFAGVVLGLATSSSPEAGSAAVLVLLVASLWTLGAAATAVAVFRRRGSLNLDELRELRG